MDMCIWWCKNTYSVMWQHVIDNVEMRVRWNGNTYFMTWICVFYNVRIRARWIGPYAWRNVRTPFRGMFRVYFVGVRNVIAIRQQHYRNPSAAVGSRFIVPTYTYSPRIRNSFRIHSRNVRNVFVICVLHIRRAKVWFLACKNPLFTLQKPPFWRARSGFLQSLN